jgi:hypothetical protein
MKRPDLTEEERNEVTVLQDCWNFCSSLEIPSSDRLK